MGGGSLAVPALAMTQEEIINKLQTVPVFLIVNSDGQPLTAAATVEENGGTEVKIPVVFTDVDTAEDFLAQAQEQDQEARVVLVDLGTLFQEVETPDDAPPPLLYLPDEQELAEATEIRSDFQGVPLFLARQGEDGPYLSITMNGESSLPVFFSRDDLQILLDRYRQDNPDDSAAISVEVLSLEWLIAAMASNQDPELDAQLGQIQLFPSTEMTEYIQGLQSQQESQ